MKTVLIALIILWGNYAFSQDIPFNFKIKNLRNFDGSIIVSVYNDAKSFDEGTPWMHKTIYKKENLDSGTFKGQFLLPPVSTDWCF